MKQKLQSKDSNLSAPGPGAYDLDVSTIKSHYPTYKIGTEQRSTKNSLDKCFLVQDNIIESKPLSYQQESRQFEFFAKFSSIRQNSSSFKERSQSLDYYYSKSRQYQIPKIRDTQMITMKGFKYNPNNSVQFPGPGQYNSDDSICKPKDGSVKIVPEQRSKAMLTKYIPGPGQYSIKSTLEGPAC